MYINYDYYRIFYYVAKYRSFTKAANALLNNQPNITRTIKTLEKELGCTLFIRSNREVTLTPEGEKLYTHIRIAMEQIQAGEQELALDKNLQSGLISIGTSEISLHCFLLPILRKFRELYPGIRIRVSNQSTPQAINSLKNGLVDLAVVTTPVESSKSLKIKPLKQIQETAICGASYTSLCNRILSLEELVQYPIINLNPQTTTYEFFSRWFHENGLNLSPDIEAATTDQVLLLVKANLGIGFIPEEYLADTPDFTDVYKLQLNTPIPSRSICLIKRAEHSLNIAATELERMILSQSALLSP